MLTSAEHEEYLAELRQHVCSRCIERGPNCPPCGPHDNPCGIEAHLPELVELCRTTDSVQMATYLDKLHEVICPTCDYKDTSACPCPLEYLLQLAVEAVEAVERRRDSGEGI
jgi:hypothetical protein